jgi:hypothetical protein
VYNQTSFLVVAAILLTAVVSIALYNSNAVNAQGNMTGGAKNMTGGAANMTKNATGAMKNATAGAAAAVKQGPPPNPTGS